MRPHGNKEGVQLAKEKNGLSPALNLFMKLSAWPCVCVLIPLRLDTLSSQQQRKERDMARQQEKGPHRRLDDMRREEDRRLAEREQVTNGVCRRARPSANREAAGASPTPPTLW